MAPYFCIQMSGRNRNIILFHEQLKTKREKNVRKNGLHCVGVMCSVHANKSVRLYDFAKFFEEIPMKRCQLALCEAGQLL